MNDKNCVSFVFLFILSPFIFISSLHWSWKEGSFTKNNKTSLSCFHQFFIYICPDIKHTRWCFCVSWGLLVVRNHLVSFLLLQTKQTRFNRVAEIIINWFKTKVWIKAVEWKQKCHMIFKIWIIWRVYDWKNQKKLLTESFSCWAFNVNRQQEASRRGRSLREDEMMRQAEMWRGCGGRFHSSDTWTRPAGKQLIIVH